MFLTKNIAFHHLSRTAKFMGIGIEDFLITTRLLHTQPKVKINYWCKITHK